MRTLAGILFWIGRLEHVLVGMLLVQSLLVFHWRRHALKRWLAVAWFALFILLSLPFWPGVLSELVRGDGYTQAHLYGGIWSDEEALSGVLARWRNLWLPIYVPWLGSWLAGLTAIWLCSELGRRLVRSSQQWRERAGS